jgi:hypothetical protein
MHTNAYYLAILVRNVILYYDNVVEILLLNDNIDKEVVRLNVYNPKISMERLHFDLKLNEKLINKKETLFLEQKYIIIPILLQTANY